MTGWELPDKRVLFVHCGISGGKTYATYYRKPSGGLKRAVSKALPLRASREEAQIDLDRWASRQRGVELVGVDEK